MNTENIEIKTVPESIKEAVKQYMDLHVPYYQIKQTKRIRPRVYKGKGSAQEIKNALEKYQRQNDSPDNIIFEKYHIGIDCSGFIAQLYEAYLFPQGKHIWNVFKRKTYNPLEYLLFNIQPIVSMLNATTLTSKENCIPITKLTKAKPMDLIRMSGGGHVVMIYETYYSEDVLKKIIYVHSTEGVGVTFGTIIIHDPNASISEQEWVKDNEKAKYDPEYLIRYKINTNGIVRPKFLL